MKLVPQIASAPQWDKYYKAMSEGRLRPSNIQKGLGGTLGPRLHARNYRNVDDTIEPVIITPTAAVAARARSEIKSRQSDNKKRQEGVLIGRGRKRKAAGPGRGGGGIKKKAKMSGDSIKKKKKKKIHKKQASKKRPAMSRKQTMARDIFM